MSDICAQAFNDILDNEIITQKSSPNNLKLADVTPVLKKEDALLLKNYRPVSALPVVSKIYERITQKQVLCTHLYRYRNEHSTQTALISMLKKWKLSIDNKAFAGGVLKDLSKAFDTINHPLLLATLHAYGFRKQAIAICQTENKVRCASRISSWTYAFQHLPE